MRRVKKIKKINGKGRGNNAGWPTTMATAIGNTAIFKFGLGFALALVLALAFAFALELALVLLLLA